MFMRPSFKKSLIVEQFQGNYLKDLTLVLLFVNSFVIIHTPPVSLKTLRLEHSL